MHVNFEVQHSELIFCFKLFKLLNNNNISLIFEGKKVKNKTNGNEMNSEVHHMKSRKRTAMHWT